MVSVKKSNALVMKSAILRRSKIFSWKNTSLFHRSLLSPQPCPKEENCSRRFWVTLFHFSQLLLPVTATLWVNFKLRFPRLPFTHSLLLCKKVRETPSQKQQQQKWCEARVEDRACNPTTEEAQSGRSPSLKPASATHWAQGHHKLHSKHHLKKKRKEKATAELLTDINMWHWLAIFLHCDGRCYPMSVLTFDSNNSSFALGVIFLVGKVPV